MVSSVDRSREDKVLPIEKCTHVSYREFSDGQGGTVRWCLICGCVLLAGEETWCSTGTYRGHSVGVLHGCQHRGAQVCGFDDGKRALSWCPNCGSLCGWNRTRVVWTPPVLIGQ